MIKQETTSFEMPTRNLKRFAFCGTNEVFQQKLTELSELAQPEIWTHRESDPLHILRHYIFDTFDKLQIDDQILISDDESYACFNTGLLTINSEEIVAFFEKNKKENAQEWFFLGFTETSSRRFLRNFTTVPPLVKYHNSYEDYYFNPDLNIVINFQHILQENKDRLVEQLGIDDEWLLQTLLKGAWEITKPKISRNLRLVIPQYYMNKISYLIPVEFEIKNNLVTMAMAVEKLDNDQYRANTIFTLDMAYAQARILMKPEADWIIKK